MTSLPVKKILIVDDDTDACAGLRRILKLDHFDVDVAHSLAEATDSRIWSEYVAVILDRRLPDGSADELLPVIKQKSPSTAVIIVTGYADLDSSIKALRQGAEDYILKPMNVDALRSSLDRILRVREAERKAVQAERLAGIGQMITGIAHESRNAIQRIQTAVDMLKLDVGNDQEEEIRHQVDKIQLATDDLKSMLDGIRDFAAPINLVRDDVDLPAVWRRAWKNTTCVKGHEHAQLHEHLNDANLVCYVDSFRLEQVFRNLFENSLAACRYNPRIEIACEEIATDSHHSVKITLRDNGPGISAEHRPRIFEPFYTTKQQGTGLGMAIVKRTIEAHGGAIRVGDGPARGAEFIITLPVSDASGNAEQASRS